MEYEFRYQTPSISDTLVQYLAANTHRIPITVQLLNEQFPQQVRKRNSYNNELPCVYVNMTHIEQTAAAKDLIIFVLAVAQGENKLKREPKFVNKIIKDYHDLRSKELAEWLPYQESAAKLAVSCGTNNKYWESTKTVPLEMLLHILSYLKTPTLMRLCEICKEWYQLITCAPGSMHAPLITKLEENTFFPDVRFNDLKQKDHHNQRVLISRCGHTIKELSCDLHDQDSNHIWYANSVAFLIL